MPQYGQPKGMNTQSKGDNETPKRRKEDEPDGSISAAVKYLKMGFLPYPERAKAEEAYERDQEEKKRKQQK